MLVVNRFQAAEDDASSLGSEIASALEVLARCAGYVDGTVGRNVDDPALWVLATKWENVGSYRRALSSYDVKLNAVPLLSRALDEPSAFEVMTVGERLNRAVPRETN